MTDATIQPATAEARPPECDMIMKGGITSGVVYPLAASHLSKKYTFRNLGGASAGAIAATIVAAAELGKQRGAGGFGELAKLPHDLGDELRFLFQPSPKTKPAYRLLTACIDKKRSPLSKGFAGIVAAIRSAWVWALLTFVVAMVPGVGLAYGLDALGTGPVDGGNVVRMSVLWLPVALLAALVVAFIRFALATKRAMEGNGFGLCDGHTNSVKGHQPLTDWLTGRINVAAGVAEAGRPVTFGDLWGPDAVTAFDAMVPADAPFLDLKPFERRELMSKRTIALEVMTTNLTLRRPYRFPFENREFFFCAECMRQYFPATVVDQMAATGDEVLDTPKPNAPKGSTDPNDQIRMLCPRHPATRVRYFPRPADVPIVLAARLSSSFPALISAVPLYYVDYGRVPEYVELITVWFSDGGIASNFPMHLFDSMWPRRPTFGINLQPKDPEHGEAWTHLPTRGQPRSHPMTSLLDFGHALLDTMQNWADVTQLTLPAYRQRVAEVRLTDDEGGMNLEMPKERIDTIAERGEDAAKLFDPFDLPDHQHKRFASSMAGIDDLLAGIRAANAAGFDQIVKDSEPLYRRAAAAQITGLADDWANDPAHPHPATAPDLPRPVGDLRMTPRQ